MHSPLLKTAVIIALATSSSSAKNYRNPAARAEFMRAHPCPANGNTRGACPGYQVDHITALVCGGTDTADNMQWLSIEEHKNKTRQDVKACAARGASHAG